MEILEVTANDYNTSFQRVYHIFNTTHFALLNKTKCNQVHFLLFKDSKIRLGIILGEKESGFYSPFSAPFGAFSYLKNDLQLEYIEEAVELLEDFSKKRNKPITITLPPVIYNSSFISKMISAFERSSFKLKHLDLNYQYETEHFQDYFEFLSRNARKNLNNGLKNDLNFHKLDLTEKNIERIYSIIEENRSSKGYPLRMTSQQIRNTIEIVPADGFVLTHKDKDIASALVFYINDKCVQVIYWGDIVNTEGMRAMNVLAYRVCEYYYSNKIKIVDIGPSTENGLPNYGLCAFKENIGCTVSIKNTYEFSLLKN